MKMNLPISRPTLYLCSFLFLVQIVYGFGVTQRGSNVPVLDIWHTLVLYWAIGWWFIHDGQGYGIKWNDHYMDLGMFLYVAWIFIVPYYLFKSRGWKAFYTILLLLGIYFGALVAGAVIYMLISM